MSTGVLLLGGKSVAVVTPLTCGLVPQKSRILQTIHVLNMVPLSCSIRIWRFYPTSCRGLYMHKCKRRKSVFLHYSRRWDPSLPDLPGVQSPFKSASNSNNASETGRLGSPFVTSGRAAKAAAQHAQHAENVLVAAALHNVEKLMPYYTMQVCGSAEFQKQVRTITSRV